MEDYFAVNISNTSALSVAGGNYIPDITGPMLLSFDLDADTGLMRLEFDETVNSETLRIRRLILRSDRINTTEG